MDRARVLNVLTGGMGKQGPPSSTGEEGDEMILAMIGSLGLLLAMTVGWSWIEARRARRDIADS